VALERTWLDPQIRQYLGGPLDDDALALKRASPTRPGDLAVTLLNGQVVGFCRLGRYHTGDLELSYAFLSEHWRCGYARESCAAVLQWAFHEVPGTGRVVAWTQVANQRSRRLLYALGMAEIDRFVKHGRPQLLYALPAPTTRR
jgi:RimJ/RimL family protein N-acetyltransferase